MLNEESYSAIHAIMAQPSLVDYPGRMAVLMFTAGCNFRCGFCHNPDLIGGHGNRTYTYRALREKLRRCRDNWVEAVTVTGGEPTIHSSLPDTVDFLKSLGFLVKLDTNGGNPDMLERLLPKVDYLAMDYKCALAHYPQFVDFHEPGRVRESLRLVMEKAADYELRTTVLEGVHTPEEIRLMAEEVKECKRWYLQPFVPHDNLPAEGYRGLRRTRPACLEELASAARAVAPNIAVRT